MDCWQRGTSVSVSALATGYTADRWLGWSQTSGPAMTISRQATSDTTNLPNIQYCARVQRNASQTATGIVDMVQGLESANSIPLAGKTVTVSFYARAGANFSAASNALYVYVQSGTGTDNSPTAFTGASLLINSSTTLTTTWQRFSYTATVGTTATQLLVGFYYTPSGTAGANDYFEVTGIQLEQGSVVTSFSRAGGTLQGELAACRRYLPAITSVSNYNALMGMSYATNSSVFIASFDTQARVAPTGVTVSGTFNAVQGNTQTAITPTFGDAGVNGAALLGTHTVATGSPTRLQINGTILFTGCEL
jgi:hypothetical protein